MFASSLSCGKSQADEMTHVQPITMFSVSFRVFRGSSDLVAVYSRAAQRSRINAILRNATVRGCVVPKRPTNAAVLIRISSTA